MATTPSLRVRPKGKTGKVHSITPNSARWTYVGFALHKLASGEAVGAETGSDEVCLVLVSGKAKISVDGKDLGELGQRMTPFEGEPYSVYVPQGHDWEVVATTALELAVCSAPGGGGFEPRVIPPGTNPQITRGRAPTRATSPISCPRPIRPSRCW